MRALFLGLAGCTLGLVSDPEETLPTTVLSISDLWADEVASGATVVVDAVVISPRTEASALFYVQQAGGGPRSGLKVLLGDGVFDWPPPVGTPVRLRGPWLSAPGGPSLWLQDPHDLEVRGDPSEPVTHPWSDDPDQVWSLVRSEGVVVTSSVDPAGLAETNAGFTFRPDLGVPTPGWNRTGNATGIQALGNALLLRSATDWTGDFEGDPPVESFIADLNGLAPGTPVTLNHLVQATPWSIGDRYALLQSPAGLGVWVDAEGFGAPLSEEGDVGSWTGQLVFGGDGRRLRVWDDPVPTGQRVPVVWQGDPTEAPVGRLVDTTVTTLGPSGPTGERSADDWLLDDRFVDLTDLADPSVVRGAIRVGEDEVRRLAVLP